MWPTTKQHKARGESDAGKANYEAKVSERWLQPDIQSWTCHISKTCTGHNQVNAHMYNMMEMTKSSEMQLKVRQRSTYY